MIQYVFNVLHIVNGSDNIVNILLPFLNGMF